MPHCAPAYAAILALSIVAELVETVVVGVVVAVGEEDGEECNNNDDEDDDTYHHHFMPYSIAGRQAQQYMLQRLILLCARCLRWIM
jgi:hypothetical protein